MTKTEKEALRMEKALLRIPELEKEIADAKARHAKIAVANRMDEINAELRLGAIAEKEARLAKYKAKVARLPDVEKAQAEGKLIGQAAVADETL